MVCSIFDISVLYERHRCHIMQLESKDKQQCIHVHLLITNVLFTLQLLLLSPANAPLLCLVMLTYSSNLKKCIYIRLDFLLNKRCKICIFCIVQITNSRYDATRQKVLLIPFKLTFFQGTQRQRYAATVEIGSRHLWI